MGKSKEKTKPVVPKLAYCPRCDRPFVGKTKDEALEIMDGHVKRAHPEMVEED